LKLECSQGTFDAYCHAASVYWARNTLPDGEAVVLVEALHPDMRVTLRNLTVANALRRITPARLVLVTGADKWWIDSIWKSFDVSLMEQLGRAFGAEVIDIHALVDALPGDDGNLLPQRIRDMAPGGPELPPLPDDELAANVDSSYCRIQWIPRVSPADRKSTDYLEVRRRSLGFAELYRQLFSRLRPIAFVTSHVDYYHWGFGSSTSMAAGIPVVYVQQVGGLKAYTAFPEHHVPGRPLRADLTVQLGRMFDQDVWPVRDRLRASAELVAWRSKGNLGRPIWWRHGSGARAELVNPVERAQVREIALRRLGLDPAKPVVVVFNHAVSDAIGGNVELFDDLADWFEQTVEVAARETRVNWLLLDHPSQAIYDRTGFIEKVEARFAGVPHLRFTNSLEIGKNLLWSLVDLGVTVRGSVSNELPAYGMPVVQAGWSEWSACGLSQVATDREDYWRILDQDIGRLVRGEGVITDEQVERARLWLWFYRAATDITTPLVPHFAEGADDDTIGALTTRMEHVEADGDPLHLAMHRMWTRREPVLTRFDLASPEALAGATLGSWSAG